MIEIRDIEKLAELARLEVPQEEKETLRKDINSILQYVGQIQDIHEKVASIASPTSSTQSSAPSMVSLSVQENPSLIHTVLREDANPHEANLYTEALLREVPKHERGYVKVKKILHD